MTKSQRRKIEIYIADPHVSSDLAKKVIRQLLDEIDELEKIICDIQGVDRGKGVNK